MTTATAVCVFLLCAGVYAAADQDSKTVIACNLKAISAIERPRYHELVKRVRAAIRERREIADGYALKVDSKAVTLPEVAEWITMERLCCPFLTLQLSAAGRETTWILRVSGPKGAKPIIAAEFPTAAEP